MKEQILSISHYCILSFPYVEKSLHFGYRDLVLIFFFKFQVTLDLSCNFIEDKGIAQLATSITKLPKGMHHLNLSHCSLTNKGVNQLAQSLLLNKLSTNTLTYLNLCGNSIKDDSQALCSFLAQVDTKYQTITNDHLSITYNGRYFEVKI